MNDGFGEWGWGDPYDTYKPYVRKTKPVLSKEAAREALRKAVLEARRSGLEVECKVTETIVKTTGL